MGLKTSPWDAADYLDSNEAIQAYIEAVLEDGDPDLAKAALENVARALATREDHGDAHPL